LLSADISVVRGSGSWKKGNCCERGASEQRQIDRRIFIPPDEQAAEAAYPIIWASPQSNALPAYAERK